MKKKLICAITSLLLVTTLSAQDWSQWRGPSRSGAAPSFTPPAVWPERATLVWKVPAGEGHSSPVVSAGRVYLLSRVGEQEAATAFDAATGRQIWRTAYDAPYTMNSAATAHGKGPKGTPLIHRGHLYTLGISGVLSALDPGDGRLLWRKDFAREFPATSPEFGAAMSPVGDGGLVIAHVGGSKNGALMAFDAETGAVRWRWNGDGPAYSSPIVADLGGTRQVITQTQTAVVGLSSADGTLLWRIPFVTDYEQNSVTPLVAEGLVIYGGLSKPTTAVRLAQSGGKWSTAQVWQNADIPMYMSTAVEAGGLLFGLTHRNRGQFFCLDVRTGKTLWTSPPRQGENAALMTAGEVVAATTTEGELIVFRRSPKAFDLIRKYTVAESPVWAHPAPTGKGLVIKDQGSLAYWTF